jgi:hypothetical protein
LSDNATVAELIVLDDIELLFDRTLQLNPIGLLKRPAQGQRVVASWPGELQENRLSYASMGHPEHHHSQLGCSFRVRDCTNSRLLFVTPLQPCWSQQVSS